MTQKSKALLWRAVPYNHLNLKTIFFRGPNHLLYRRGSSGAALFASAGALLSEAGSAPSFAVGDALFSEVANVRHAAADVAFSEVQVCAIPFVLVRFAVPSASFASAPVCLFPFACAAYSAAPLFAFPSAAAACSAVLPFVCQPACAVRSLFRPFAFLPAADAPFSSVLTASDVLPFESVPFFACQRSAAFL